MILMICYLIFSCTTTEPHVLDREDFEDRWWEIQQYPICFNFHYGDEQQLLTYETVIVNQGQWEFVSPNEYEVHGETISVVREENCWKVDGYEGYKVDACECTLIPWQHTRAPQIPQMIKPVNNKKSAK